MVIKSKSNKKENEFENLQIFEFSKKSNDNLITNREFTSSYIQMTTYMFHLS